MILHIKNIFKTNKYKATLAGKDDRGDKYCFVSTFKTETQARHWVFEKIRNNEITDVCYSVIEEYDGTIEMRNLDSYFEEKRILHDVPSLSLTEDEDEETQPKPEKKTINRKWYEAVWDTIKRMR